MAEKVRKNIAMPGKTMADGFMLCVLLWRGVCGRSERSIRQIARLAGDQTAVLDPARERGRELALRSRCVLREIGRRDHVAPAAIRALVEEPPGPPSQSVCASGISASPSRFMASKPAASTSRGQSESGIRDAEKARDAPHLAVAVRLEVVVVDEQQVRAPAFLPEGALELEERRAGIALAASVA